MALPGDTGALAIIKQLKVLMPPSLHKLRISDDLAGCFEDTSGGGGTALAVSPFGKVWRVEVSRDGDGAFLGRGWPEFLATHGVSVGWFVVLRHQGSGVLTFKAFNTTFCIKEFAAAAAGQNTFPYWRNVGSFLQTYECSMLVCSMLIPNSPYLTVQNVIYDIQEQQRSVLQTTVPQDFSAGFHGEDGLQALLDTMFCSRYSIPSRFVKRYLTGECLNRRIALIVSPLGKFWRIELQNNQSGVFFAGIWPQFLAFNQISEGEVLLLRYEGNMVFKFTVFGFNGCQKVLNNPNTAFQQNCVKRKSHFCIKKRKADDERARSEEENRLKISKTSLNTGSSQNGPNYQIGPSSWIKKEVTAYMLKRLIKGKKAQMSLQLSWLGGINKSASREIDKKTGLPCSSSMEYKSKNCKSGTEEQLSPESPRISVVKASSYTKSAYEIGPPSWIKKEIKTYSLEKHLFLAQGFCNADGLQDTCTITLKTSVDSTRSWQVRGAKQRNGSYLFGSGWKKFSHDNELKVGDVCTFNIAEMSQWHVTITRV